MARRKSGKKPDVPPPANPRLSVQASKAYLEWVEGGADFCRTDVSKLVDAALTMYLRSQGYPKSPPKRVP